MTDLSKYAAGKRLKCIDADGAPLVLGHVYESHGTPTNRAVQVEAHGVGWLLSRFVPVEDEAPVKPMCKWGYHNYHGSHDADSPCIECGHSRGEIEARGPHEPALSPGHAIREPVRLNEAQRESIGLKEDPYALHRAALVERLVADGHAANRPDAAANAELLVASAMAKEDTARDYWNPKEPTNRERLIAALRRDLDDGSRMKAFPKEGRSDWVYRSNDR